MPDAKDTGKRHSLQWAIRPNSATQTLQQTEDSQRRTLPALPAVGNLQTKRRAGKIQKHQYNLHKRRNRDAPDLFEKFNDALEANRDELIGWVEHTLMASERDLNQELDEITADFSKNLRIATKLEKIIQRPFADEQMEYTDKSASPEVQQEIEDASFGARMAEVECYVAKEEKVLDQLWHEWFQVQVGIVGLAAEVLGLDAVAVEEGKVPEYMKGMLVEADRLNGEVVGLYQTAVEHIHELGTAMKNIISQTTMTVEAQQRQWRLDKNKKVKALKEAISALEDDD